MFINLIFALAAEMETPQRSEELKWITPPEGKHPNKANMLICCYSVFTVVFLNLNTIDAILTKPV